MSYSATHRRSIYLKTLDGKWLDHVRVRQLLNLPSKLPRDFTLADTTIMTSIGPITAFVIPGLPAELNHHKRIIKRSNHRVLAYCPHVDCKRRVIPIGRLHQHLPIHGSNWSLRGMLDIGISNRDAALFFPRGVTANTVVIHWRDGGFIIMRRINVAAEWHRDDNEVIV